MNILRLMTAGMCLVVCAGNVPGDARKASADPGGKRGPDPVGFSFSTDRADALYALGQEAVFTVTATNGSGGKVTSGKVTARLDNYGPVVIGKEEIDLSKTNPFTVKGTLREPGFLRLTMSGPPVVKRASLWAVGFEPSKIRPGGKCPDDFDAFWKNAVDDLEKTVPLDPRLVYQPELSTSTYDFWRVSFATYGGTRVWGFLSVPKDKSKAPFPVAFEVPSAGKGRWTYEMRGRADRIRMYMTVHRVDPPRTQAESDEFHRRLSKKLKKEFGVGNYAVAGLAGAREDHYFYRAILGINRAANWLWARDDVDRGRFEYSGGSQGGCFGWYLCGLNPKFTSAVLRVPAGTDLRGYLANRASGWPQPVSAYPADKRAVVESNAAYFDGVSFAPRIKCPVRVTAGFIDNTCPPCAVYATFNVLGSADKKIFNAIGRGHGITPPYDGIAAKWQESRQPSGD